ncbi:MAG: DNA polymerase II large subunit [Archaeoglobaceae archaeon]|nr:DNA polymerase II large subunit [Archaeoglobaceae archaeon]MDW8117899.1 DNA polymerase II large subunit [Archaeoglobaceae archaeon]
MEATLDKFFPLFDKEQDNDYFPIESIKEYHKMLSVKLEEIYKIAELARSKGLDPETKVEILIAKDMAERVEKLIGLKGVAERIKELEEEGIERDKICFKIADDIIDGKFGKMDYLDAIDKSIRTAVAIMTEGVVAAPIEGIAKVSIDKNNDGSSFLKVYYAGPIRSAGGTAQVISVLIADYARRKVGLGKYIPTEEEVLRYCEEIQLYKKVANLQYLPSDEEIGLIVSNCPICIDGEPTEEAEVSGYRNLPRVETNRVRGGMALIIAEGIALKAPKLKKMVDALQIDGWSWLDKLIKKDAEEEVDVKPKSKYLSDLVAGRPVLSHPSKKGGFRLRYGRARNSGLATVGINPATMALIDFIAIGTQLKIERPGKAGSVVPVTTIEGPTVRLKNGDVVKINSFKEAVEFKSEVEKILDLGEILINYGDFLENNHPLIPSSYCKEWWALESGMKDLQIDEETALKLSDELGVPMHPDHTYLWHDISVEDFNYLRDFISSHGKIEGHRKSCLFLPFDKRAKEILENLLVEHKVREGIVVEKWKVLVRSLGLDFKLRKVGEVHGETVLEAIKNVSGITVRPKALSRIGARMGRPEKAKERKMSPPPHLLFPVSFAGGKRRDVKSALDHRNGYNSAKGLIEVEIALRKCKTCGKETFWVKCECGEETEKLNYCPKCRIKDSQEICKKCGGEMRGYAKRSVDIRALYEKALQNLGEHDDLEIVKGVIGLTSKNKVPERVEKGILRAKHGVYVFKDGTIRYDMTDLPLTHFKPKEIGVSIEKLKELGYTRDHLGVELKNEEQIVELKPQDIVISRDCAEYLVKVAKFIDDLLVKFYKMESFYRVEKPEDLIGHLVIGLAPHTSAGVLGRIIGFADILGCYAHPYFHAAKRRNCDGDEDCVMLLLDGLLNFSRHFLPEKRGGQMDAPLVLTVIVDPKEVDKEVHNMDIVAQYPLEFYKATLEYANPKECEDLILKVKDCLSLENRFCMLKFTHDTDITLGVKESAYKKLKTMEEKVEKQMELARKISAVDEHDVAERVITIHFLPDIIGNLRAFSRQEFRCVDCNEKYRRLPLNGKCRKCGGNLTLTVHSSSIVKYLELSKKLCENYNVSEYTRQRLKLIEYEIKSLLIENKQVTLVDVFN